MVEAVLNAASDDLWISPQLAAALLQTIEKFKLAVGDGTSELLAKLAGGARSASAREELGLSGGVYRALVEGLRTACSKTLPEAVELCDSARLGKDQLFAPDPRPTKRPLEVLELSPRQLEVMEWIASGLTPGEIVTQGITPAAFRSLTREALGKFRIKKNTAENRLWVALYLTGSHRDPDVARRRFELMKTESADDPSG